MDNLHQPAQQPIAVQQDLPDPPALPINQYEVVAQNVAASLPQEESTSVPATALLQQVALVSQNTTLLLDPALALQDINS